MACHSGDRCQLQQGDLIDGITERAWVCSITSNNPKVLARVAGRKFMISRLN